MPSSAEPSASLEFATAVGKRMAYIDEGRTAAIVFQHGNPTSSLLWRNVMRHRDRAAGISYMEGIVRPLTRSEWPDNARGVFQAFRSAADRRPTLTWPRMIPVESEPPEVVSVVSEYANWLVASDVPKHFINADPGSIPVGPQPDFRGSWPNQTDVTVKGIHLGSEDSPDEIGAAVADFVQRCRPR